MLTGVVIYLYNERFHIKAET